VVADVVLPIIVPATNSFKTFGDQIIFKIFGLLLINNNFI